MTKLEPTQQRSQETKILSDPLSDPEFWEALRRALAESADQGDLFDPVEQFSKRRLHEALLESLDYIERLLDELQLEDHQSMSLGRAYARSQQEVNQLRSVHQRMMQNGAGQINRSHFTKHELWRDEVLRLTRQSINIARSEAPALFEHLEVSADHGGEWGCHIRISPALQASGGALITIEPAHDGSFSVACRYLSDDRGVCVKFGMQLVQRIFSSLDVTPVLASEHV